MRELVRWNPFSELTSWHRDIDDLFDRFMANPYREGQEVAQWWPTLDSFEKDGKYFVRLDLPGVDPKEVEVIAEDGALIIKGERKGGKEVEEKNYHYRETSFGRFERRMALPKGTDTSKIEAHYDNGVLEVSMQLPAHLAAKKVPIQIEGGKSGSSKAA